MIVIDAIAYSEFVETSAKIQEHSGLTAGGAFTQQQPIDNAARISIPGQPTIIFFLIKKIKDHAILVRIISRIDCSTHGVDHFAGLTMYPMHYLVDLVRLHFGCE